MRYLFESFELDTEKGQLLQAGKALHAEPQVLELLEQLVKHANSLLTKDALLDAVWPGKVVSDAAISSRIKTLRQLLGDSGKEQRLLKTVHKKGFRFVANVEVSEATSAVSDHPVVTEKLPTRKSRQPRIAVLPFSNLSQDDGQNYLAEGISSDIIAHLSKYGWLSVIARNTIFGISQRANDAAEISDTLSLDYLVEGTLQKAGDRLRVQVHLNDTSRQLTLWSDRYDRNIDDIFELQDEITATIVARLEPEISQVERNKVMLHRPSSLEAWDCYHLGIYHLFKFTLSDHRRAETLLKQSTTLDNQFAAAYAWWAYSLILGMVYWENEPSQQNLDLALAASDEAVSLEPKDASFRMLRARVLLARREYAAAIQENVNAIEMNPSFAAAYCGMGDSLAYEGQYDEAIAYFEKAIALSPNDPQLWAFYTYGALALIFKEEYGKALDWINIALTIPNCQYWTLSHQVVALTKLEREDEAKQVLVRIRHANPWFDMAFVRAKLFYLKEPRQIQAYLDALQKVGLT